MVSVTCCCECCYMYLLVFHMWIVSSSTLSCLCACSSRKSKKYLTAGGTAAPEHKTLRKKSSTNCCNVPCNTHTHIQTKTHKTILFSTSFQQSDSLPHRLSLSFFRQENIKRLMFSYFTSSTCILFKMYYVAVITYYNLLSVKYLLKL